MYKIEVQYLKKEIVCSKVLIFNNIHKLNEYVKNMLDTYCCTIRITEYDKQGNVISIRYEDNLPF